MRTERTLNTVHIAKQHPTARETTTEAGLFHHHHQAPILLKRCSASLHLNHTVVKRAMPLPPALLALGGPATVAAAKAAAYEYLPALSSASLAYILGKLAWKRLPDWIKEDVAFGGNNKDDTTVERLSTVWEKIQAWIQAASEQLKTPVPHLWAALLIYWQLCAQLDRQQQQEEQDRDDKTENEGDIDDNTRPVESRDDGDDEDEGNRQEKRELLTTLSGMLNLATWAYYLDDETFLREQLATAHFDLQGCHIPGRPGSVGYYWAKSSSTSSNDNTETTMLIGIKGTTSLEELLTDACGRSVSYHGPCGLDDSAHSSHTRVEVQAQKEDCVHTVQVDNQEVVEIVSGHERIIVEQEHHDDSDATFDYHVRCHQGILIAAQRLFQQLEPMIHEQVIQNKNGRLLLVGHSLGASTACCLALLLRSRYPTCSPKLHVYAFAPPPVLDHDSAIAASAYVTSMIHQSDLIARSSLVNVAVLLELLQTISTQLLIAKGMAPDSPSGTAALLRQLATGDKATPFWTREELFAAMARAEQKVELRHPNHLYVPGKLYFVDAQKQNNEQEEESSSMTRSKYSCKLMDVTAPTLRTIELNGYRMLGDHTTTAYRKAMDALLAEHA